MRDVTARDCREVLAILEMMRVLLVDLDTAAGAIGMNPMASMRTMQSELTTLERQVVEVAYDQDLLSWMDGADLKAS